MKTVASRLLFCVLFINTLPARGQIVRLAGGMSSVAEAEGATAALYESDSTTRIGAGYAQGVQIGASRQVEYGATTLTAGDTSLELKLPTDLQDAPRILPVRGFLLQNHGASFDGQAFAGFSGADYSSAYFSSVHASHPLLFFSGHREIAGADFSSVQISGVRNSSLASVSFKPGRQSLFALTAGFSAGAPMVRAAVQHIDEKQAVHASYTSGQLRLQPEPALGEMNLERIGLNLAATRRVGKWFLVDGARHEYATYDAAAASTVWRGVTAGRSSLLEGGVTVRAGGLQGAARVLHSFSGTVRVDGNAMIIGWTRRTWNVQATTVSSSSTSSLPSAPSASLSQSRTTLMEGAERLHPRLLLRETITVGGGSSGMEIGGVYDGDRMSLSIGHREVFVPFGAQSGFRRLLVLSVRFRFHDSEVGTTATHGAGLPDTFAITSDGYYGQMDGGPSETTHAPKLPKYAVRGTVLNSAKEPIRGAAVAVGRQVVYTASDGTFLARLQKNTPVAVALRPAEFLSTQNYSAVSPSRVVTPERDEPKPMELIAAVSRSAPTPEGPAMFDPGPDDHPGNPGRLKRGLHVLATLGLRMLRILPHREAAQA